MDGSFTDDQVHEWLQGVADLAWVSMHYDTPALGGIGFCEISGGGYTRQKALFSQPTNRSIWTLADLRWAGLTQNKLTHFGIWTAQHAGRLRAYGELPEQLTILDGWGHIIYEGELAISID